MRYAASATADTLTSANAAATPPPVIAATAPIAGWRLPAMFAIVGSGHLLYGLFNHAFDYVLYPYAVYTLGVLTGGLLMTLLSLLQCAATLLVYERMRIDWVGGGLIDTYAQSASGSLLSRALGWLHGRQRWLTFAVLCAITDPFIVTAFFRRGRFGRLGRRDWQLFFASVLLCNLYWIFIADFIAHGAVAVWQLVRPLLTPITGVTA